jgi:hypothetical protein
VRFADPWDLRSGVRFLEEVTEALYDGGAWISSDASMPDDFTKALRDRLETDRWRIETIACASAVAGPDTPLIRVAAVFEVSATRLALATASLSQHVALVDLRRAGADEIARWFDFAARFMPLRRREGTGLSLCVLAQAEPPPDLRAPAWVGRIRRADTALWADIHALPDRPEPLGQLVHAIGIELLGWRLDLVKSFMQAATQDAMDPVGWLRRREEKAHANPSQLDGRPFACPLHLLHQNDERELRNRLWRAHLSAIFPWIEEQRQRLLQQYGDKLSVSDLHRDRFRVSEVVELEISEIARQLGQLSLLPREAQLGCFAMGDIRKNLAHRKPAAPRDLLMALNAALP